MPSPITTQGSPLSVYPQYNPLPAQDFVNQRNALLPALAQGADIGASLQALGPLLQSKIAQANQASQEAIAQTGLIGQKIDAQKKALAAQDAQNDLDAAQHQAQIAARNKASLVLQASGLTAAALSPQQSPTASNPFAGAQDLAPFAAPPPQGTQTGTGAGSIPVGAGTQSSPQSSNAGPIAAPTSSAPASPANLNFNIPVTPPVPQAVAQPAQAAQGSNYGLQPNQINQLVSIMTPDQALELGQNIRAAQTPAGQAQIAKLYADVAETVGRGNYYNSFATLKNAQANNLLTTGGRYGLTNLVLSNFAKDGGDVSKAFNLDDYQEASQQALQNGDPPPDITDYINKDGFAQQQQIIQSNKAKGPAKPPANIQQGLQDGTVFQDPATGEYHDTQTGKVITPVANGQAIQVLPQLGGSATSVPAAPTKPTAAQTPATGAGFLQSLGLLKPNAAAQP